MHIHDTDSLTISKSVIANLCGNSTDPNLLAALLDSHELPHHDAVHCIHHVPDNGKERAIAVPLKGSYNEKTHALVSVARVAFAACRKNNLQGLRKHEEAQHTCSEVRENGKRLVCINPAHLIKG